MLRNEIVDDAHEDRAEAPSASEGAHSLDLQTSSDETKKQECYICKKWYCRVNRHLKDVHKVELDNMKSSGGRSATNNKSKNKSQSTTSSSSSNSSVSSGDDEIKSPPVTISVNVPVTKSATVKKHKKNNLIIKADIVKKLAAQSSVSKEIQPPTQLGKRNAIELGEDLLPAKGGRTVAEYNTAQLLVDLSPNKLKARMPTYDTAQLLVDLSPNKIKAKPKKETKAAKEAKESKEAEELAKLNDGIVNV
jgi:hypothetical protein